MCFSSIFMVFWVFWRQFRQDQDEHDQRDNFLNLADAAFVKVQRSSSCSVSKSRSIHLKWKNRTWESLASSGNLCWKAESLRELESPTFSHMSIYTFPLTHAESPLWLKKNNTAAAFQSRCSLSVHHPSALAYIWRAGPGSVKFWRIQSGGNDWMGRLTIWLYVLDENSTKSF